MRHITLTLEVIMKLSLILTLFGMLSVQSYAAEVGDSCTQPQIRKFYLQSDRYCFAEMLSCESGKLVRYDDGSDAPADPDNCPGTIRPACPNPMALILKVAESKPASYLMNFLRKLKDQFFAVTVEQISDDGFLAKYKHTRLKILATPLSDAPVFWHFPLNERGPSREWLKEKLEKEFPGELEIEICPGHPQLPSVVGSN